MSRLVVVGLAVLGPLVASAVEYPLAFTPTGNYKDLVVAGYAFSGSTVVGNCSYTRITSGSGRDPKTIYTPVPETCTWDLTGKLLGSVSGAPTAPTPVGVNGTQTIYAMASPGEYTGVDSALTQGGFVFSYGSHYHWVTSNAYLVLPQGTYNFQVTLISDGDVPLAVHGVSAKNALTGAKLSITGNTCTGSIPLGGTCTVSLSYTDKRLSSTTGLTYDTFTIHLDTDALATTDFVQSVTDEVRIPRDGGGG